MKALFSCVLLPAVLLAGCVNTKPRPMTIACGVDKPRFVAQCVQLLKSNGYQIIEENPFVARVRATKGQNQVNMGENVQYNGPYLFDAAYDGTTVIVSVATTIRTNRADEPPFILQTHNESRGTSSSDKAFFMPVLTGLRQLCGKPK